MGSTHLQPVLWHAEYCCVRDPGRIVRMSNSSLLIFSISAWICSRDLRGIVSLYRPPKFRCLLTDPLMYSRRQPQVLTRRGRAHGRSRPAANPPVGSNRRHLDQPRRAGFLRQVRADHGYCGPAAEQIYRSQKNRQRGLGREPAVPGAVLLFGRHQPPRSYFDELQKEEGYRAVVEMSETQMSS